MRWDESVIEKPESLKAERLCAVRSSKACRLKRIKPGFYNLPTGRPVLELWCHRTGKWSRSTAAPLYRLRLALSLLWLSFRPLILPRLNSG